MATSTEHPDRTPYPVHTGYVTADDGTRRAYHRGGRGRPLVCLPGGPMRASVCLGTLGGLDAVRELVRLDLRGTGESAEPASPAGYRCDRQVADVEALRRELGEERIDLPAHSAGGELALLYAARYPARVARLVLVTPTARAVGVVATAEDRLRAAEAHRGQPWFPEAYAALRTILSARFDAQLRAASAPLLHGRWDAAAQRLSAEGPAQLNPAAAQQYADAETFDPPATRRALARHGGGVLVLAGERDGGPTPERAAELAALLPRARSVVQQGAGHFPWLDDPERFAAVVGGFLDGGAVSGRR